MPERRYDVELEKETNDWMRWGFIIMVIMVAIFPIYRIYEPSARADARQVQEASLVEQGSAIYSLDCAACHGPMGGGGIGPALNSKQFLASATNDQIVGLISVGVPGTQMSAYSLDYGGPLTSEQIEAISSFLRSWEENAPDLPGWRDPLGLLEGN